jgi:BCD family chlorophyll transporter-like MFS transporter
MTRRFSLTHAILALGARHLPFADAASPTLPLPRLLRLSLFQVTVGMATVLLVGTLNRVMIVELGLPAALVATMVALPLVLAPARAFIGFRSDAHRSALGWRRVPYIWLGTMLQFGGLAIMPFALLVLSMPHPPLPYVGAGAAALAFLLVGAGLQITQTAGLALASDLSSEEARPRVVALMYVALLLSMVASGAVFALLLAAFSEVRLIQVIQGAALITFLLNVAAIWKMEPRDHVRAAEPGPSRSFRDSWARFAAAPRVRRFLVATGLGTAGFMMQDIVLEPYGGQILGLGVGGTSALTALLAAGALTAFALAARLLARGRDALIVAALGVTAGLPGFAAVALAAPLGSTALFHIGVAVIGFGGGLFSVGTLTAAMGLDDKTEAGLALGAWGAVTATAGGTALALGGIGRDAVSHLCASLAPALAAFAGYAAVYGFELVLLLATLVAIGPLVRHARRPLAGTAKFGLADLPV